MNRVGAVLGEEQLHLGQKAVVRRQSTTKFKLVGFLNTEKTLKQKNVLTKEKKKKKKDSRTILRHWTGFVPGKARNLSKQIVWKATEKHSKTCSSILRGHA